jgi:hypothetical protein
MLASDPSLSPISRAFAHIASNALSAIMIRRGLNAHRNFFRPMAAERANQATRLANTLELRLRDNFAVDRIVDGRGFGSQLVDRQQSDLAYTLYAIPSRK